MAVLGTAGNSDVLEALGTGITTAVLRRIEGYHEVWFMVVVTASSETWHDERPSQKGRCLKRLTRLTDSVKGSSRIRVRPLAQRMGLLGRIKALCARLDSTLADLLAGGRVGGKGKRSLVGGNVVCMTRLEASAVSSAS